MSIPPAQTSTLTRDLRHLFSSVALRTAMKAPTPYQKMVWKLERLKPVQIKDRIMQWNIVPGDFVRPRPGINNPPSNQEKFEVLSIDKYQNRVYLKGITDSEGKAKFLPYAACQLYMGDFYVGKKDRTPVYATRIGCTNLKYNWRHKRFEWVRYAEATTPRLSQNGGKHRRIPWPPEPIQEWTAKENKYCDTSEEDALLMTWRPYIPGRKVQAYLESQYISDLYKNPKQSTSWQDSLPVEHFLLRELTNPLSRAQRQERWQAQMEVLEKSKEEYVRRELVDLRGRRRQDATRDGLFRWKLAVHKYKARKRWQRWVKRGGQLRLNKRLKRRQRRSIHRIRRLKAFKLKEGKNQVIPAKPSVPKKQALGASAAS